MQEHERGTSAYLGLTPASAPTASAAPTAAPRRAGAAGADRPRERPCQPPERWPPRARPGSGARGSRSPPASQLHLRGAQGGLGGEVDAGAHQRRPQHRDDAARPRPAGGRQGRSPWPSAGPAMIGRARDGLQQRRQGGLLAARQLAARGGAPGTSAAGHAAGGKGEAEAGQQGGTAQVHGDATMPPAHTSAWMTIPRSG